MKTEINNIHDIEEPEPWPLPCPDLNGEEGEPCPPLYRDPDEEEGEPCAPEDYHPKP